MKPREGAQRGNLRIALVIASALAVLSASCTATGQGSSDSAAMTASARQDDLPNAIFMATNQDWVWNDLRDVQFFATACINLDRWDGRQWLEVATHDNEFCTLGATDGISFDMPSDSPNGIYRWCGLSYAECYVFEYRPTSFNEMFGLLENWVEANGDAWVSRPTVFEGQRLGLWTESMRYRNALGNLPDQQIARLESLPGWAWTTYRPASQRADTPPDPVFMATQRKWERNDLRDPQSPATDCSHLDQWSREQWLQIVVKTDDAQGWVTADEHSGDCQLGAVSTINVEMPEELARGIYRWCGLGVTSRDVVYE